MRTSMLVVAVIAVLLAVFGAHSSQAAAPLDIVIRGGRIVDGAGAPWYVADVGIRDGKIEKIGRIDASAANRAIEAAGLVVAPGFIDMMGQTATPMLNEPQSAMNLLTQGITTINAGEGVSAAPLGEEEARRFGWRTMREYFDLVESKGLPVNVAQSVGHTQVRRLVLGEIDRRPSDEEMRQMAALVREAMEAGAIGVSTALIYPPAVYAQTEEIAQLAAVAGEYGGRYFTHMRNEGDRLEEAIDEALEIGRRGNTPVHIFHLKAAGRQNWGKMQLAIAKIKAARAGGQQVTADVYPYLHNGLGIAALIHPRHFADGPQRLIGRLDDPAARAEIRKEMETTSGWENWYRHVGRDWNKIIIGQTGDRRYAGLAGQSVAEMARSKNEDPWDTFFQLVRAGAFALPESMSEPNKILALQQEFISFCTDVGPAGGSQIASHPRAFGAFPRLFSHYVRDLEAISLERAVAQASAAAANAVMAYDRCRIAEGLAADIVVFDYEKLADRATFSKPNEPSAGMKHVLVNGTLVLEDGKFTGARPGKVLRGPGLRLAQAKPTREPENIGSRLEPFVDDRLLERLTGSARLQVQQPLAREVVLVADAPWEGNTSAYFTVFQDGDKYRMYYRGSHFDELTKKASHREVTCYAESRDGIRWDKPELGLFEFNGSTRNNIVWDSVGSHCFTPFLDANPAAGPEARYKALTRVEGGLLPLQSADGIHWSVMSDKPVITRGAFDSQNLAFWDSHAGKYREYHRGFRGVRDIMTGTSDDFLHWNEPQFLDYRGAPPEHLYTNTVRPYPGAPHLLIGFPTRFLPATQQTEPVFMVSRDGASFRRYAEPLIPITAPADRDGNRSNYMAWGLVQLPARKDEWSVYAKEAYYTGKGSRLRRFTYTVDRLVGLTADAKGGEAITVPLRFAGGKLVVNYRTSAKGAIRIEIDDEAGQPISGFALADGQSLRGDATASIAAWSKGADVSSLAGRAVRLRIVLSDAELYSLRFVDQ